MINSKSLALQTKFPSFTTYPSEIAVYFVAVKISFHMKKKVTLTAWNLQSIKAFFESQIKSASQEWSHFFLKQASCCLQLLLQTWKRPVCVLASPTSPSSAWALPQKLSPWCLLQESLPNDRQGLELRLKLELCHLTDGFYLCRNPRIIRMGFEFFLGLLRRNWEAVSQ